LRAYPFLWCLVPPADIEGERRGMRMVPTPLTGEEVQSAIKELPCDPEIGALYKRLAEEGPLPPR
jgi:hypothetical protein